MKTVKTGQTKSEVQIAKAKSTASSISNRTSVPKSALKSRKQYKTPQREFAPLIKKEKKTPSGLVQWVHVNIKEFHITKSEFRSILEISEKGKQEEKSDLGLRKVKEIDLTVTKEDLEENVADGKESVFSEHRITEDDVKKLFGKLGMKTLQSFIIEDNGEYVSLFEKEFIKKEKNRKTKDETHLTYEDLERMGEKHSQYGNHKKGKNTSIDNIEGHINDLRKTILE